MNPVSTMREKGRALSVPQKLMTITVGTAAAVVGATALEVRRRISHPEAGERPSADLVRSVTARMTTPLLPDDYLHMINPALVRPRAAREDR